MSAQKTQDNTLEAVNHRPKLSVIIPLYNHEQFIKEAISSVLGQSFSDFELIIINDGSTDGSEEAVKGIDDRRIHYFSQRNQGAHNTINRGIRLARGEYISILNSDDVYYPTRLEECVRTLENDDSLHAVFSHMEFIDGGGNFIKFLRGAEENWATHDPETSFKDERNTVLDLLAGNFLATTSNLFCRREVFDTVGPFAGLRYAHDYDFFLRLCCQSKVYIIEKPLLKYRIHEANTVKENEAAVSFEVGLALTKFFLRHGVADVLRIGMKDGDDEYTVMMKFLNSLNTRDADRVIFVLLLFGLERKEFGEEFLQVLTSNHANPFRQACVEKLRTSIDGWTLWHRTNEQLIAREKDYEEARARLGEMDEARRLLREKDAYIDTLRNSYSFRLGQFLTWPLRKLFCKNG